MQHSKQHIGQGKKAADSSQGYDNKNKHQWSYQAPEATWVVPEVACPNTMPSTWMFNGIPLTPTKSWSGSGFQDRLYIIYVNVYIYIHFFGFMIFRISRQHTQSLNTSLS